MNARRIVRALVATPPDAAAAVARVTLGTVVLAHGLQKAFGWWDGDGFGGTMRWMTGTLGVPWPLAFLGIVAETAGMLLLIAGAGARVMAFGAAAMLAGAIALVHAPYGFFMNWSGTLGGEGYELHLLGLGLAAVVMIRGAGAWSVDRLLAGSPRQAGDSVIRRRVRELRRQLEEETPGWSVPDPALRSGSGTPAERSR